MTISILSFKKGAQHVHQNLYFRYVAASLNNNASAEWKCIAIKEEIALTSLEGPNKPVQLTQKTTDKNKNNATNWRQKNIKI